VAPEVAVSVLRIGRQRVWAAVFALLGLAICPAAAVGAVNASTSRDRFAEMCLALLGIGICVMVAYGLLVKLEWTNDALTVVAGPWRRTVSLTGLSQAGYRRSGRTAVYVLRDSSGRTVKVDGGQFARDDEWKSLVLAAADRVGATVDARARVSLGHPDGSGRAFLA
jgi:hypothetical protein